VGSWLAALYLVPLWGSHGAALAALTGPLLAEVTAYVLLRRVKDFRTVDGVSALAMALCGAGIIAAGFGLMPVFAAALVTALAMGLCIWAGWRIVKEKLDPISV